MKTLHPLFRILILAAILATGFVPSGGARAETLPPAEATATPIKHLIVLMQENHTFDNYFGTYPGVDGIPEGVCMPVDPTDPQNQECVKPWRIGDSAIQDPDHSPGTFALQYNGGKMDGFVYALNQRRQNGKLAMGYYDYQDLPYYWNLASEYVLMDRFFSSEAGGSFGNHMFWVAGVPGDVKSNVQPGDYDKVVTIFDRLEEKGVSWKFYVQNYDPFLTYRNADQGGTRASQVVWVPLLNFDRFIDNPELNKHIVDLSEYYTDLENGTLPAVAYIAPSGASEHPPGSIQSGQTFVKSLIQTLMRSSAWDSSAFLLVYDDWGGWYDHVVPPQVDEDGYGFRVPGLLVSAYARKGYIDNTTYDYTSILKFIQENWGVQPMASRDAAATSFIGAFDFESEPRPAVFLPSTYTPAGMPARREPKRQVIFVLYGAGLATAGTIFAGSVLAPDWLKKARKRRTGAKTFNGRKGSV